MRIGGELQARMTNALLLTLDHQVRVREFHGLAGGANGKSVIAFLVISSN